MSRKPDYRLKFLNKETEEKGELGGAWLNKDGSITLVLDPKVCLMQDRNEVLTLFPQPVPNRPALPSDQPTVSEVKSMSIYEQAKHS